MNISRIAVLKLLILSTAAGSAVASDWDSGPYFGAGISRNDADFSIMAGNEELDFDETGYSVALGYQFGGLLRLEGGYVDFGSLDEDFDLGPLGMQSVGLDADGYDLAAVLAIPLSDDFSLYAKGGFLWWDADIEAAGIGVSDDGRDEFYGVGAKLQLTDRFALVGEYEQYELGDLDVDVASLGVSIDF